MKMTTEKRTHERIPLDMEIIIFKFDTTYSGTLKNISQNGIYIEMDKSLPFRPEFDFHLTFKTKLSVLIPFNNDILEVPIQFKRLVKDGTPFIGMGSMLLNPSPSYMDFMNGLNPTN